MPGSVDGPYLHGMGAVAEARHAKRAGAGCECDAIQLAFEAADAIGVAATEGEGCGSAAGDAGGCRQERGIRREDVDQPGISGRGRIDVAGGVDDDPEADLSDPSIGLAAG